MNITAKNSRRTIGPAAIAMGLFLGAVSCTSAPEGPRLSEGGSGSEEWSKPPWHGAGVRVPSAADAQAQLPFHLLVPKTPDGLQGIYLPPGYPPELRSAWFTYKSDKYGWVWIGEGPPDVPNPAEREAGWKHDVALNTSPGPGNPQCEIVFIRDNVEARECVSDFGGVMEFVQNEIEFDVQGPKLSRDDLLGIANGI